MENQNGLKEKSRWEWLIVTENESNTVFSDR